MSDLIPTSPSFFTSVSADILAELLADKRSPETRRAYEKDLKAFFKFLTGIELTPEMVGEFLRLKGSDAIALVLRYKASMVERGLAEATVNRRLAAIKSLCNYARKVGKCEYSLQEVCGEKMKSYRDTSGVSPEVYAQMLGSFDRTTLLGLRNYALLRLLWENALRRGEVVKLNVGDFDPVARTLIIFGKGKGTQSETIDLSQKMAEAICAWLNGRGECKKSDPLFISLSYNQYGHRLSGDAIYDVVSAAAKSVGITRNFSPHRVRHSAITAALDIFDGNVREVKKLSRHARLDTLVLYDDNRRKGQKSVSERLSSALD